MPPTPPAPSNYRNSAKASPSPPPSNPHGALIHPPGRNELHPYAHFPGAFPCPYKQTHTPYQTYYPWYTLFERKLKSPGQEQPMSRERPRYHNDWDEDERRQYRQPPRYRQSPRKRPKRRVWPWLLTGCAGGILILVIAAVIIVLVAVRSATNSG